MSSRKHSRRHDHSPENDYSKRHSKKSKRSSNSTTDALKEEIKSITEEDYFEKATEFRVWLKEKKGKYFSELDSEDSRYYFKKFVKAWNRSELEEKYYKGLSSSHLTSSDTTRYRWSFAKKVNQDELDTIRDSVDTMTNRGDKKKDNIHGRRRNVGPALPESGHRQTRETAEERYEAEQAKRRAEAKKIHQRRENYLDEIAPKETGREAMMAKRRATNSFHKREKSPDVELCEADLMGGDDFQSRLAAEKQREERRNARRNEHQQQRLAPLQAKVAEYKAKESATIEMFRKMAEEQRQRGGL